MSIYRHYTGKYYRLLYRDATSVLNGETFVVYQQLYATLQYPLGHVWIRADWDFDAENFTRIQLGSEERQFIHKRFELVTQVPRKVKRMLKRIDSVRE